MHQMTVEQVTKEIASVLVDVRHGEETVITDHDVPFAKVIPVKPAPKKRRFAGSAIGVITYIADDFDETPPGFEEYL